MMKLNNDNTRLRGARDAATSELVVLKAKEAKAVVKELKGVNEFQKVCSATYVTPLFLRH